MDEFTPGPWHVSTALTVWKDGRDLAYLPDGFSKSHTEFLERKANITLMAAAPDLLAALERTLNWLTSYPGEGALGPDGPYYQARAAIAKAKGENDG
jgi:hypothetical protein